MPINPPDSTLAAIQQKVRRLTRTPSTAQLSDNDLNNYINTFVVYDFPEHLRTFNLRTTFTFYTTPYQDAYPTDEISFAGVIDNPLYNFQNTHLTVHPPVYIAGYLSLFSQSREQFFGIYPKINSIVSIGKTGDGVTSTFTGTVTNTNGSILLPGQTINASLLQREVLFSSVDSLGAGLAMVDVPVVDTATGDNFPIGNLYRPGTEPTTPPTVIDLTNNINYKTGVYTVTFPNAPAQGVAINSQTVPTILSLPQALLYYDNTFFVRPVPDQPYRIQFETYVRPTYLMATNQSPKLEEWWQYIVYGAVKKIFEDRMDMDSVQMIMPEFKKQEALCLRRTIVQYTNERTATIYTEQVNGQGQWGQWGQGGGLF